MGPTDLRGVDLQGVDLQGGVSQGVDVQGGRSTGADLGATQPREDFPVSQTVGTKSYEHTPLTYPNFFLLNQGVGTKFGPKLGQNLTKKDLLCLPGCSPFQETAPTKS